MTRNYLKGAIGDHINLLMAGWPFFGSFPVAETANLSDFLMEI